MRLILNQISLLFLLLGMGVAASQSQPYYPSGSPTVAVLTLEVESSSVPRETSYIKNSYLSWLEQNNMRWIEINFFEPEESYLAKLEISDALLLTGGGQNVLKPDGSTSEYFKVAKRLINYAVERNQKGGYFPLWGTCLGFQSIVYTFSRETLRVATVDNPATSGSLHLLSPESRFFRSVFSHEDILVLENKPSVLFHHTYGYMLNEALENQIFMSEFSILASAETATKKAFVGMIEHKHFPIFGTQFHPEAMQFLYNNRDIDSHLEEIQVVNRKFSTLFRRMIQTGKDFPYPFLQDLRGAREITLDSTKTPITVFKRRSASLV